MTTAREVTVTIGASISTGRLSTLLAANPGTSSGQAIAISGRSSIGDGGEGFAVWDASSTATADNATVWGSGTGRWLRVTDGKSYNVRWWGAHPTASAATNGAAINAAIAAAVASSVAGTPVRRVIIPAGNYQVDRTIYLGGTLRFTCLELCGEGYAILGETDKGGSALVATFSNAPLVNVQGARGSVVRDLALVGPNKDYIPAKLMALPDQASLVDDTAAANWWDPTLSANGATRYAPSAGVAIDGWSGSAPGTAYPTTYVAYGQNYSSDVMIENCYIAGFNVGIVNQPCNADGNADFTVIRRCTIVYCAWGISVGNTQSRQVGIQDCKISQVHTALTNNQHGAQLGKFNGTIDNLSMAFLIQVFEFGHSAYFGPLKLTCCYTESVWRLGNYSAGSGNEQSVSFEQCQFGFHLQDTLRGVPTTAVSGASQTTLLRFNGCTFVNYPSVLAFNQERTTFTDCYFHSAGRDGGPISKEYIALMHNATCDGLVLKNGIHGDEAHSVKFQAANLDTLAIAANVVADRGMRNSDRKSCVPLVVHAVCAKNDAYSDEQFVHRTYSVVDKSSLLSCSLTHGASSSAANIGYLTIVLSAITAAEAENGGYAAGDLIVDDATQSVFAIRSFDDGTNTIIAELQNNYKISGGNYTTVTAFSTTVGNLYFHNTRLYTPNYPVLADVTSGSAVLASTGRDDTYSAFIDSGGVNDAIKLDDRVAIAATLDSWVSPTSNKVTAIASGGGSITLAGNAARTVSRKRLPIWIRKPPTNEASR